MRKFVAIAMAVTMLSGCASQATQNALNQAKVGCIQGYGEACKQVQPLEAQARGEANENTGKAVVAAIVFPLLILYVLGGGR